MQCYTVHTIYIITYTVPSTGLYFMLNGTVYLPGDTILITDIGAQNDLDNSQARGSLICVTTNVNTHCCRTSDGGNIGEWFFPSGAMVPRNNNPLGSSWTRSGFTHQIRLNRIVPTASSPLGDYECRLPINVSVLLTATITLTLGEPCSGE